MLIRTALNILINAVLAVTFVYFNIWALQQGLEETFVSLAVLYGFVTIVFNAAYVAILATWPQRTRTTTPAPH